MLKNNGKVIIGRNLLFCLCVICLIFTSFGFFCENSFAVELNETIDETDLQSSDVDQLENSQDELMEVDSQDSQEVLGAVIRPSGNTFKSIETAVNSANSGDTIKLSGTYTSSGNDHIVIKKKLTITADSMATLDSKNLVSAFELTADGAGTVFNNLKFINGNGNSASAIFIAAKNVHVQNCIFEDNHANKGGAVCTKYDLDIASGTIIDNCQFRRNSVYFQNFEGTTTAGAAAVYGKDSEIRNCIFEDNYAKGKQATYGGAIQIGMDLPGSNGKVTNCVFKNNRAISLEESSHGGAGCVRDGTVYSNCIFINNSADEGGALTFHASGEIINCSFIENSANEFGGALSTGFLYDYMELNIKDCSFEGNYAPLGGAIQIKGLNVLIDNSDFADNHATGYGGAINIEAKDVTITSSVFDSNIANVNGGAVYINGKDTLIEGNSFVSNEAIPDISKLNDGLGGAIYVNSSRASIKNNSFKFNTARNGSAIYYDESGERLTMENNELYQNQAWVYGLPISTKDIYYGDSEDIKVVLFGGNNLADFDNLAVSNAIYNGAENINIVIDNQYPVHGATDTGDLYQDSREYNINVLLTVKHEDGTVVYNNRGYTNYLGEINVKLDNLKAGKYYVSAVHNEDTYYKAISNETTFTVTPKVDNEVKKSVSNSTPNFEDIVVWTITVRNHGPSNSTNVVLSDILPDGLVWINDTSGGKYNPKTGILNIALLKVDELFTFNITSVVNRTGKLVNEVNVTSDELDSDMANNHDEKTLTVNPASDLAVVKSTSDTNPNYRDSIDWTIEITNNGPDSAHDVVMRDLLPESLIYVSSDNSYDAKTGIWRIEKLEVGQKAKLTIRCIVNATGLIENYVMVNATEYDNDLTNNNDTGRIFVNPASDLAIDKSVNATNVNFNDIVKWTLVITNNGPDEATNVCVIDLLPEGFTYLNSTADYDDDVFKIARIGAGSTAKIEICTLVETTGRFVNYANVTSDCYDIDLTNNEDEEVIFVNPASDLSVKKSVSDENPNYGDVITWTIEVVNNGVDTAHNVIIRDLLPDSLIWVDDDSSGDYNHVTGILTIDELEVDESFVLNIDCRVNGNKIIRNNVSVTADEYDYNLTNNFDYETTGVSSSADLSVDKSVNNSSPNYRDLVRWTLVISNNGPDAAANVRVVDLLPEGFTYVSSTMTKGKYANGVFTIDEMADDEDVTIEIVTRVEKTGNFTNHVNVTSDTYDFDLTNNEDDEDIFVNPASDLSVTKSVSDENPNYGDVITWTIEVVNKGFDAAHNVIINDMLPKSLIWIGDDSSGKYDSKTGVLVLDELGVDESFVLNIDCKINSSGTIENNVSVTADEYDYDLANNNDSQSISVNPASDLSIVKGVNATGVNFNDLVRWTLVVSNSGPDAAVNVCIVDILPDGFTYVSSTMTKGKYANGVFTIDKLAAGEDVTIDIVTLVEKTDNFTNHANVTSDTYDFDFTNNEDDEDIHVNPAADLSVTKSVSDETPDYGDVITWTIEVVNNGLDVAHNVRISDLLADGLIWVSDDSSGKYDSKTGVLVLDELGVDESFVLNIDCRVNSNGTITNDVSVTADEYDYDLTNNNDSEIISVNPASDLSITKTVNATGVNFNDLVKWTLTITNSGPDAAVNVCADDILPKGFTYVASSLTQGKYDGGIFKIGTLSSGKNTVIEIITLVETTGNFTNHANVTSDTYDYDLTNNDDEQSIFVNPAADLSVTKSVSNENPNYGDVITWTIEVSNSGPDAAHNVIITDLLADGLLWTSDDSSGKYDSKTGLLHLDELGVNESYIFNIRCMVSGTGPIQNNVSVTSDEYDYDLTNNFYSAEINVLNASDISIVKMVNNSSPVYNELVKWTLVISNNGPDKANNIYVNDKLPDGLILVNYTLTKGVYGKGIWAMCCLEVGETQSIDIICQVKKTGQIVNLASIHADEYDYDLTNNNASASIDVPPAVDLAVVIKVNDSNPLFGQKVNWLIKVTNNGPDNATEVVLEELVPKLMLSHSRSNARISAENVWNIGSVNVGESVYLNVTTTADTLGVTGKDVSVSSKEYDWNMQNNYADDKINVKPVADLSIEKLVSNESPKHGEIIRWTLIVSNHGPNDATNVVVEDKLPEGLRFVSSNGNYRNGIWKVGSLKVNETKTLVIVCKVTSTGSIRNVATVRGDEYDPDESDNRAKKSVRASPVCDLSITKTASKSHYKSGDVVEYVIKVVNRGPDSARNVKISEVMDNLLKMKSFKATKGKFTKATKIWTIKSLANGESARLIIKAVAVGCGTVKNSVSVISDTFDSDMSNNRDSAIVKVDKKPSNNKTSIPERNSNVKTPSNLEMHPTANPVAMLVISLLFSMGLFGCNISKKR